MFSEGQKRRASLNILEKLRSQGVPSSEKGGEEFDSMFAELDEEGNISPKGEEDKKKKKKKKTELPDLGEVPEQALMPQRALAGPA